MAELPEWLRSPYDRQLHAIEMTSGEVTQALCEHSAPRSAWDEDEGPRCYACLLLVGLRLSQRRDDQWR